MLAGEPRRGHRALVVLRCSKISPLIADTLAHLASPAAAESGENPPGVSF